MGMHTIKLMTVPLSKYSYRDDLFTPSERYDRMRDDALFYMMTMKLRDGIPYIGRTQHLIRKYTDIYGISFMRELYIRTYESIDDEKCMMADIMIDMDDSTYNQWIIFKMSDACPG